MTGEVSSRRVCALLGIHERVLRRRLQADGTGIAHLIGAARLEVARQLLGETQLTLAEIASALGYSDATAFSRGIPQLDRDDTERMAEPDGGRPRCRCRSGRTAR